MMRQERIGGLTTRLVGGTDGRGGGKGPVVVLLHGFGAPGDDLVPLWEALAAPTGTRFFFPEAPLSVFNGAGRAWWMIDLEKVQRDQAAGRMRDPSSDVPPGLRDARAKVIACLDSLDKNWSVDPRRMVLGGFSQGAMLSCDVALRTDRPLAGLVLMSGTLLNKQEWIPLMKSRRGLPVLQSHGSADPLLPFVLSEQLRDLLVQAEVPVEWVPFRGGHEIPPVVLAKMGRFLTEVLRA
jgi:phospholipase/carboxylesterase